MISLQALIQRSAAVRRTARCYILRATAIFALVALSAGSLGCTTKIPPPTPPPFAGEIVEIDIGEVPLVDAAGGSHAIKESVKLPRKAMLRIHGGYQFQDPDKYLPIGASIIRLSNGNPVKYSDAVTGELQRGDTGYAFTLDILAPQSGTGEFDLVVKAGTQFVAHGKVVVKD
jgi:hypothetical protein